MNKRKIIGFFIIIFLEEIKVLMGLFFIFLFILFVIILFEFFVVFISIFGCRRERVCVFFGVCNFRRLDKEFRFEKDFIFVFISFYKNVVFINGSNYV